MSGAARGGRGVGLGLKAVTVLIAVALAPLVAAAVLIDQMAEVAQNFASNQAERLRPPLVEAQEAYRELIATKKRLYRQLAQRTALAVDQTAPVDLAALFDEEPDLQSITVERAGAPLTTIARPAGPPAANHRALEVAATAPSGARVRLGFAADLALVDAYRSLGKVLAESRQVESMRGDLPPTYRTAFLLILGGVVLVAGATGVLLARRLTGRIDLLVSGTRKVAGGDLATRVALPGRDELAELGAAFDRMVEELEHDRGQILYLQRMAAWQDVARRLAHEIKNPLTPIQLAVQELHSSYAGDDPRHKKMLADAAEIVGEEIGGLRRLVDAFRELGRLPEVDAHPLDLSLVAEDLARDPAVAEPLDVVAPAAAVVVCGDRLLLRRVLANLVENGVHAGKAAGRGGRVRLSWSVERGAGVATVLVDDEGAGVAAADRARIFEPYVTTKETGTGLGLAIAKKIALEHRGDLEVDTAPAPGLGGARFRLTVPLA